MRRALWPDQEIDYAARSRDALIGTGIDGRNRLLVSIRLLLQGL